MNVTFPPKLKVIYFDYFQITKHAHFYNYPFDSIDGVIVEKEGCQFVYFSSEQHNVEDSIHNLSAQAELKNYSFSTSVTDLFDFLMHPCGKYDPYKKELQVVG